MSAGRVCHSPVNPVAMGRSRPSEPKQPQRRLGTAAALCCPSREPGGDRDSPRHPTRPGGTSPAGKGGLVGPVHSSWVTVAAPRYITDSSLSPSSLGWVGTTSPSTALCSQGLREFLHPPPLPASCPGTGSWPLSRFRPAAVGPASRAPPDLGSAGFSPCCPCMGRNRSKHPRGEGARGEPGTVGLNDVVIQVN